MKQVFKILVALTFGQAVVFAQNNIDTVVSMTKKEADREFGNQSPRKLAKDVCRGISDQLRKEGGSISIDSVTKVVNAATYGSTCVQKLEVHKEGLFRMLAEKSGASQDAAQKILDKPSAIKTMLENSKAQNVNSYCNIPLYRSLFEHGMTLKNMMIYDSGRMIGTFTITDKDCLDTKGISPVVVESDSKVAKKLPAVVKIEGVNTQRKPEKESTSIRDIALALVFILLIAYLALGGTKKEDKEDQDNKNSNEVLSGISELSTAEAYEPSLNNKDDLKEKSNDFAIISIIFACMFIIFIAYDFLPQYRLDNVISLSRLGGPAGFAILPSLILSIIPFYIYRGIAVFIKEIKKDDN